MPGLICSVQLLIVIALMQSYLSDARSGANSLKVSRRGPAAYVDAFDSNVNSSCAPEQYQLEYYNELYSSGAINSFSGNAFYYTLKALKTHNNRSKSAASSVDITAEDAAKDNAVIASITDKSRFTPASMETTNKVVCAQILQELDAAASVISNTAVCPWDYICDYKADRYPHYLFKARCKTSTCSGNCNPEDKRHNMCQSHGIHATILQMRGKCGEWVWSQEIVPIACTCTIDVMMKM